MSEQSYIIRIYRSAETESSVPMLDGIVETPESGERGVFHDSQGLWAILAGSTKTAPQGKAPRGRKRRRGD